MQDLASPVVLFYPIHLFEDIRRLRRRLLSDHVRPSADLAGPEDYAKRDELRLNWEQRSTDPLEYTKSANL